MKKIISTGHRLLLIDCLDGGADNFA